MNVLHVVDKLGYGADHLHGVGRLVLDVTGRLNERGVRASVLVLREGETLVPRLAAEGVPVRRLPRSRFDPRTLLGLHAASRAAQADILHLHGFGASAFGRIAARWYGAKAIVHVHDDFHEWPAGYPSWMGAVDALLARCTDRCIAVSETVARSASDVQGFAREIVRVLHNPVDLARFRTAADGDAERVRASLGVPHDAAIVVSVTRFHPEKGVEQLLDAWARLKCRPDAGHLVLLGDGPLRADLEAQAHRLGIANQVTFAGFRSDVAEILPWCSVFAFPSRAEPFGTAALEAMACGVPVAAFAVGGLVDFVRSGTDGLLVQKGDPAALAEAIGTLLGDEALRTRMGESARGRAAEFGLDRYVENLLREYRAVAAESPH